MPNWKAHLRRQVASLNLSPVREAEIVEELAQHAEDRYRELRGDGETEHDACRIVIEELSGSDLSSELLVVARPRNSEPPVPGARGTGTFVSGLWQDLRYGVRTLRKSPGFAAIAIAVLALGIGANTAIFSVVNGVLLRPLPYPDPGRLVRIYETSSQVSWGSAAYPNFLDWRSGAHSFAGLATFRDNDFNFTSSGDPEQLSGKYVSASLFETLGVTPLIGRNLLPDDDHAGAPCAVVLGYGFWKRRFGGDPKILARILTLNAAQCAVVGVLRRDFPFREDIYVPIEHWNATELHSRESHPGLVVVGRLRPGATMDSAQAELSSLCAGLARVYPATNKGRGAKIVPMKDDMVAYIRPTLLLLVGAVGCLLAIACANVANLMLARSTGRTREFAIRSALGAERGRIVRQLLTESVLLSLGGAVLGLFLAQWGIRLMLAATPDTLPRSEGIGIDPRVLLFTVAISIVTGILFGLAPAFHGAKTGPQEALKEGSRGAGGGRRRTEGVFVAMEVALAVILLTGAGLILQSIWRLWRVNPGFNTRQVLTAQVALSPHVMASPGGIRLAYEHMLRRVSTIPGVQSVGVTSLVPLGDTDTEIPYWPGGGPPPVPDRMNSGMFYIVTPQYPVVMQIPLREGRLFTDRDTISSSPVVLIDEVLAKRVFPGQDPVGKTLSLGVVGAVQIVGVVGHVKHWGLDSDDTARIRDQMYFPFAQVPDQFMTEAVAGLTLVARTGPEPLSMVPALRAQVAGPTRDQPVYAVRTMEQIISRSLAERRFTMFVLVVFAAAALLLAAVGIYGVMSYTVTRRTHELGIRATLGASSREIVGLVVRQGMTLAAIGITAGVLGALGLTRLMAGLLYGVQASDPLTLAGVALVLGGIALVACYIPASRAAAVDPVVALRCE